MKQGKHAHITVRLPQELLAEIDTIVAQSRVSASHISGLTRANVVRQALVEFLDRRAA